MDAMKDFLESLVDLTAEAARTEAKLIVEGFKSREVPPIVGETAAMTVAVSVAVKNAWENQDKVSLDEIKKDWLKLLEEAWDNGIETMKKQPPKPAADRGFDLNKLRELFPDVSDETEREFLTGVLAGEKCQGCGEVHELNDDERSQMETRLAELGGRSKKHLH